MMLRQALILLVFLLALLLAACRSAAGDQGSGAQGAPSAQSVVSKDGEQASSSGGDLPTTPPDSCPVTRAAEPRFVPPPPYPERPPSGQFWFGDEALWTALYSEGVWRELPHDERGYTQKVVWWRDDYNWQKEPLPDLVVSGRRLDAEAPPLMAYEATNGYVPEFESFMLVGAGIPTAGCWEITGEYQGHELSFVVWVSE